MYSEEVREKRGLSVHLTKWNHKTNVGFLVIITKSVTVFSFIFVVVQITQFFVSSGFFKCFSEGNFSYGNKSLQFGTSLLSASNNPFVIRVANNIWHPLYQSELFCGLANRRRCLILWSDEVSAKMSPLFSFRKDPSHVSWSHNCLESAQNFDELHTQKRVAETLNYSRGRSESKKNFVLIECDNLILRDAWFSYCW